MNKGSSNVFIAFMLIILFIELSGCTSRILEKNDEEIYNDFVGTWNFGNSTNCNTTFVFLKDGTAIIDSCNNMFGTYEIKDGKLITNFYNITKVHNYSFSNNNETLTLTEIESGKSSVYTRKH